MKKGDPIFKYKTTYTVKQNDKMIEEINILDGVTKVSHIAKNHSK